MDIPKPKTQPRLLILTIHPIQYQMPQFQDLHQHDNGEIEVPYAMQPTSWAQGVGLDQPFHWDIPLLQGYPYTDLPNAARRSAPGRFGGCQARGRTNNAAGAVTRLVDMGVECIRPEDQPGGVRHRGRGCGKRMHTGYRGKVGIFEMPVPEMRTARRTAAGSWAG